METVKNKKGQESNDQPIKVERQTEKTPQERKQEDAKKDVVYSTQT